MKRQWLPALQQIEEECLFLSFKGIEQLYLKPAAAAIFLRTISIKIYQVC